MRRAVAPARVALFLAPLIVLQAWAQVAQWVAGYRPFRHPPGRVAFSWDMYAVRVERCTIRFDPPLVIGGRTVPYYHSMRALFEWDGEVWDDAGGFEVVARSLACEHGATAELTCFVANGTEQHRRVACPR